MQFEHKIAMLFTVLVLLISLLFIPTDTMVKGRLEHDMEDTIVKLRLDDVDEDVEDLKNRNYEIVDQYGNYALLSTTEDQVEELEQLDYNFCTMDYRNKLHIKGRTIDLETTALSDLNSNLSLQKYEPGDEGLYILQMIGPVSSQWKLELNEMGVDVINYVPNYAYEVVMTPEKAERVEDLHYVDWVEMYHPDFKILEDTTPGQVEIKLLTDLDGSLLQKLESLASIERIVTTPSGTRIQANVQDTDSLRSIAHMELVYHISPQPKLELRDEVATQIIGGGTWVWDPDEDPYNPYRGEGDFGAYANQLGYTGKDVVVAVADTGIGDGSVGNAGHPDFTDRVISGKYWEDLHSWEDEHGHGTHCAGSIAGDTHQGRAFTLEDSTSTDEMGPYYAGQGLAPGAELHAQKIFELGWPAAEYAGPADVFELMEEAKQNADAYVHSNSWGDTANLNEYTSLSASFDEAVRDSDRDTGHNRPMIITVAAGNSGMDGENTIGPPATGKNVISVGATENFIPDLESEFGEVDAENPENVAFFSSQGWTEDNRVKPDVVAPGSGVISTTPEGGYVDMSGTSMSTPAVSGAAAVVVEWYEGNYGYKPSPAMVKALLINTAYDLCDSEGNTGSIPNQKEGWGMVNLVPMIDPPHNFLLYDQRSSLNTGEKDTYTIEAEDPSEPLKITLAWTDESAEVWDSPALKNNLDIEIISPDGRSYIGNAFDSTGDGVSDTGFTFSDTDTMASFDINGNGFDDVNNVQNIYIEDPVSGKYEVRVFGRNVPADANNDGEASQDYSIVMQNAVYSDETYISLDRYEYGEKDEMEITVQDLNRAGDDSLSIDIESESDCEELTLQEMKEGVFKGEILLSPEMNDNSLKVSLGEKITALYRDQYEDENWTVEAYVTQTIPGKVIPSNVDSGDGYVELIWEEPEDGKSSIECYNIYRDGEVITSTEERWFEDTDVDNGVGYWYKISAVNRIGEGEPSVDLFALPQGAPDQVTELKANAYDSSVELNWDTPSDGGFPIEGYYIYRQGVKISETENTTFNDIDVKNGVKYTYQVRAFNQEGDGKLSEVVIAKPIGTPRIIEWVETKSYDGSIELLWTVPDDGGSDITYYNVYRNDTLIDNTSFPVFIDEGLKNNVSYNYTISAVNNAGEGNKSEEVNETPVGPPRRIRAIKVISNIDSVELEWEAPDDQGSPIQRYHVYRDDYLIGISTSTSFLDENVEEGTTYKYYIVSVNEIGESEASQEKLTTIDEDSEIFHHWWLMIGGIGVFALIIAVAIKVKILD